MKKALITGINGQDGILFADYILKKGYKWHKKIMEKSSDGS